MQEIIIDKLFFKFVLFLKLHPFSLCFVLLIHEWSERAFNSNEYNHILITNTGFNPYKGYLRSRSYVWALHFSSQYFVVCFSVFLSWNSKKN